MALQVCESGRMAQIRRHHISKTQSLHAAWYNTHSTTQQTQAQLVRRQLHSTETLQLAVSASIAKGLDSGSTLPRAAAKRRERRGNGGVSRYPCHAPVFRAIMSRFASGAGRARHKPSATNITYVCSTHCTLQLRRTTDGRASRSIQQASSVAVVAGGGMLLFGCRVSIWQCCAGTWRAGLPTAILTPGTCCAVDPTSAAPAEVVQPAMHPQQHGVLSNAIENIQGQCQRLLMLLMDNQKRIDGMERDLSISRVSVNPNLCIATLIVTSLLCSWMAYHAEFPRTTRLVLRVGASVHRARSHRDHVTGPQLSTPASSRPSTSTGERILSPSRSMSRPATRPRSGPTHRSIFCG